MISVLTPVILPDTIYESVIYKHIRGNKMEEKEKTSFFKRKDIEISAKRYLQDALSAMALGLFASLLIGVIFDTIGEQTANIFGENAVSSFLLK